MKRRMLLAASAALLLDARTAQAGEGAHHPDAKWYRLADEMKRIAESWGDQGYGAIVVLDGVAVGFGPSRVIKDRNPDAHAERVAIRDAQLRLGRSSLPGSVLYSTSRPCTSCEGAASEARIARMYFGAALEDGGPPKVKRPA